MPWDDYVPKDMVHRYQGAIVLIAFVGVLEFITIVLIVLSSIMCLKNFGRGLKESLIKQQEINTTTANMTELS